MHLISIVSTGYGLVNDDFEYLAYYLPGSSSPAVITIHGMAAKNYNFQWLDPMNGTDLGHGTTSVSGSGSQMFPLGSAAPDGVVLHVRAALELVSAGSRKTHSGAGDFDVSLPLSGAPGIECRSADPATGTHTFVFTFTNPIVSGSATVTGTAAISGSPVFAGNTVTVNLSGVANAQIILKALLRNLSRKQCGRPFSPMNALKQSSRKGTYL